MRNLKRVLSLTLASVMLLGMMVIGTSAATDYPDVDYSADNVEAIEVLEAVNVMTGYPEDGTFKPGNEVSRAEMARIMAALMDLDYDYYVGVNPFTDMRGHWAEGYAAACAANGIIAGRTTTTYDPSATVTAVEAAAMLMRALGYFQNWEADYADGFEISTIRQAGRIGLFDRLTVKTNEPMTRNDVAQLVLNTLQSGMVEPDSSGTMSVTTPDGYTMSTGATNYVYTVARNNAVGQAINATTATSGNSSSGLTGYILDLGEQLYQGELKLKKDEIDVFGRPSRKWEYKGQEIGTYRKVELLYGDPYTAKITGKDLYDRLGSSTIADYDLDVYIDGVYANTNRTLLGKAYFDAGDLTRTNDEDAIGGTGNGVLTEVYVDTETKEVTVAIINTYLAKAEDDYDERDDDLDLKVYKIDLISGEYVKTSGQDEIMTVSGEDFPIQDVEKNDLCLVNIADGEIQTMQAPEIVDSAIIDSFNLNSWVSSDGTKYNYASTARYDTEALNNWDVSNLKETTYNIILDPYGYLIGLEKNSDPDQYVFLTGIDAGASNLYATTADANVIHMDGTMETVKVNMTKSYNADGVTRLLSDHPRNLSQVNRWCKYGVNDSGVYTLRIIDESTTTNLTSGTNGKKVAQFAQDVADHNDKDTGGKPDIKEINEKRVSLVANDNAGTKGYVYGNDKTVYLNVSLKRINVDDTMGGTDRWIIDDVDSVTTGIANVNIEVRDLDNLVHPGGGANPKAEIYTLYNNKGIVLAAVTIGEDNGASNSYAFITGGINEEDYGHTSATKAVEGKWTWYRNAIVNGEKTRLTETGEAGSMTLDKLSTYEWYEIRYNANGEVRRANLIGGTGYDFDNAGGKFIDATQAVEWAMAENGTVLLYDRTTVDKITFSNGTLYTDTANTKGFYVSGTVKTVVINANKDGTSKGKYVWDGYNGWSGVEKAIKDMNSRGNTVTPGTVQLSAILVNGTATVIVLKDDNPEMTGSTGSGGYVDSDVARISWTTPTINILSGQVDTLFTLSNIKDWNAGSSLNVSGDVWVNGLYAGRFTNKPLTADEGPQTSTTTLGNFSGAKLFEANTVELRNVTVTAQQVHARILDENGNVLYASDSTNNSSKFAGATGSGGNYVAKGSDVIAKDKGVPVGSTTAMTFNWTNNGQGAGTTGVPFTVKGGTVSTSDKTFEIDKPQSLGNASATGRNYFDVVVTTAGQIKTYTVSLPTGASGGKTISELDKTFTGDIGDNVLSLDILYDSAAGGTFSSNAGADTFTAVQGTSNYVKVEVDASAWANASQMYGVRVELKIGTTTETVTIVNDGTDTKETDAVKITANTSISISKITELKAPEVTGITYTDKDKSGGISDNDDLVVTFDKDVKVLKNVTGGGENSFDPGTLTPDTVFASTKTITGITAPTSGTGTLTFGAATVESRDGMRNVASSWLVPAGGKTITQW